MKPNRPITKVQDLLNIVNGDNYGNAYLSLRYLSCTIDLIWYGDYHDKYLQLSPISILEGIASRTSSRWKIISSNLKSDGQ
jgi:hypothetical protein